MLRFYNTLTARTEDFVPLENRKVRMYICGPTVYGFAHIGNFRTFLFGDILRRHIRHSGYDLLHVMNITDVDDKTIRNSIAAGLSLRDFTDQYIAAFNEDCQRLRLEQPELVVRATDHIQEMAHAIKQLQDKGFTYTSEGSIYYRIANFANYGKLSKIDVEGMMAGARVDNDEYEKADARDFVLWKAPKEGEPFWETEIGPGRPGWHIECSVMAGKYLGDTFDIHAGGVDLAFPHHENEIAQSEALTGKQFVRYWLHAEHLLVDGQKMSKSLGNFYTLRDLLDKGYAAESIRYLLSSVPYRKQLNFTLEGLRQAAAAIERLRNFRFRLANSDIPEGVHLEIQAKAAAFPSAMRTALDDDLNTAAAHGALFELVRDANTAIDAGQLRKSNIAGLLAAIDEWNIIFDVMPIESEIGAGNSNGRLSPEQVEAQLAARLDARKQRQFALADQIRDDLIAAGIIIEDSKGGSRWRYK
ncbi:MAG: cysteine--tRNA ligase [Acidobacteria bacterium]|nr:cysteine--tRNA ligase [Acidobacteriota bacterium]